MSEHEHDQTQGWERDMIARIALEGLHEQRRARRWGIFFKICFLAYLGFFAWIYLFTGPAGESRQVMGSAHTALVQLTGVIGSGDPAASSKNVLESLTQAFENKHSRAVLLHINSPGGSPVQSGEIYEEILRLRELYPDKALYAVVSDLCASGGYYVAAAADEIYANRASIIGSIGVIYNGFGFVEAMGKLGIRRRLLTAGEHKGILDPFSPLKEPEVAHFQELLDEIHRQFIGVVQVRRGERLTGSDEELFSGLFWTGERSLELGLVDGLGDLHYVAREVVGEEELVDYTRKQSVLEGLLGTAGGAFARGLLRVFSGSPEGRLR